MWYLMNYGRLALLLLIVSFVCTFSYCQEITYKLIVNQGNNSIIRGDEQLKLKTGESLLTSDKLILQSDSYVVLLSNAGSTIELKGSQQLQINLNKISGGEKTSELIGKYAEYVASKMLPDVIEKNRKEYASVTGAVERALGIIAYMKKTSRLYESFAILRWDPLSGDKPYKLEFRDGFGNLLFTGETNENHFRIDFTADNLADIDLVIVDFIDATGNKSSYSIALKEQESEVFTNEIMQLKSSLNDNSAFGNLILAELFEQNNYFLDASTCFEKSKILEPDVDYFSKAYLEFLMRNKLGERLE